MSEYPNDESTLLNIVSEDDNNVSNSSAQIDTEIQNCEKIPENGVYGYTPTKNEHKLKDPNLKKIIERYLAYYINKKIASKNTALKYNKNITEDDIQNSKQHVKRMIRAGNSKIEINKPNNIQHLAKNRVISKSIGIHTPKPGAMSNIRDEQSKIIMNKKSTNNQNIKSESEYIPIKKNNIFENKTDNTKNYEKIQIILLNFEDDTFKPVIKICDKNIEIINKWYETCQQIMDIEETNINVPDVIKDKDIAGILYKNINCKHKDLFIYSYFPKILNNITLQNKIRSMESQMSVANICNCKTHEPTVSVNKKIQSLSDLNILIPKNMVYTDNYFYMKGNNKMMCPKYKKSIIAANNYYIKNNNTEATKKSLESIGCYDKLNNDIEVLKTIKKEENIREFGPCNIFSEKAYETNSESHNILTNNSCQIINENGYSCYNAEYDILHPPFGLSCQLLDHLNTSSSCIKDSNRLIIVLINVMFLQTIVIVDPDLLTIETIFENGEYGFIELFTFKTNNDEIETLIQKQFNTTIFNNIEELNQTLSSTSQLIDLIGNKQTNTEPLLEEEKTVKYYFKQYFEISDDVNTKMKASTLYDIIINSQNICKIDKSKLSGFKNRLSNYLKELGLQKKRYNDGYYYYGIVKREKLITIDINGKNKSIEEMEKERELLTYEMNNTSNFYLNTLSTSAKYNYGFYSDDKYLKHANDNIIIVGSV
jgi:hypothetical protein